MEENNQSTPETIEKTVESPASTPPVLPEGTEAPLDKRILAAFIDMLVAIGISWAAGMINGRLGYPAAVGYLLTRDSLPFLEGQSLGKKVVNLQAVNEGGKSLSGDWTPGIIRNIPMIIPFFPLIELIILVINKDKPNGMRRLGDQFAKTKVITVNH
ncbi:RDD family protein [Luteolibacter algae]|uniref:RDD family protein n=1 Tax=Luteolibacter algae TaxID=454151 RepID=A0ABW5D7D2_9BACT